MAITRTDYEIFRRLRELGHVPVRPTLLEIGEAEYYGDVPIDDLLRDVGKYADEGMRDKLIAHVRWLINCLNSGSPAGIHHALAKVVYRTFFDARGMVAIDLHGTPNAARMDLNSPDIGWAKHDIVYNTGTAEHIFRIGGVLQFIHEATARDGLMIHVFPFTGLVDHGFYSIQPTLIRDLAAANGYEILHWTMSTIGGPMSWLDPATAIETIHWHAKAGTLPADGWLHVAYRKATDAPFRVPTQRVYSDAATAGDLADWKGMR